LLPTKPAASAAVTGRWLFRSVWLSTGTAFLLRRGKRPAFVGILWVFLKVRICRITLLQLFVIFEINRKTPTPHPPDLIGLPPLKSHSFTLLNGTGIKNPTIIIPLLS
jgi:hypothetical protein